MISPNNVCDRSEAKKDCRKHLQKAPLAGGLSLENDLYVFPFDTSSFGVKQTGAKLTDSAAICATRVGWEHKNEFKLTAHSQKQVKRRTKYPRHKAKKQVNFQLRGDNMLTSFHQHPVDVRQKYFSILSTFQSQISKSPSRCGLWPSHMWLPRPIELNVLPFIFSALPVTEKTFGLLQRSLQQLNSCFRLSLEGNPLEKTKM